MSPEKAFVVTADGDYEGTLEGYDRAVVKLRTAKGNLIVFPWHVVLRVVIEPAAAEAGEAIDPEKETA